MSLCALCGQSTGGDYGICLYHVRPDHDNWAAANRRMCDFLHRGIVPLPSSEPIDLLLEDLVGALDEAVTP